MISTAKLFQNGQSQAVRLPKEFRFDKLTKSDDFMQTREEPIQKINLKGY
ncbi:MAG: AbrB/MazE/SpoVT family DNA-binding domain-containing protein [Sulfurovum sp.]|nr:AbrB/MazE/SpoVT family DNA-binding domain-containing protein [Sulfurovum sp.]